MSYQLRISDHARRQFEKVKEPYKSLIEEKMKILCIEGYNMSNLKMLKGNLKSYFRLRVSDYRIVFYIKANAIQVESIDWRKDIY